MSSRVELAPEDRAFLLEVLDYLQLRYDCPARLVMGNPDRESTFRVDRFSSARSRKVLGMHLVEDSSMPQDEIEFRLPGGERLVVGVGDLLEDGPAAALERSTVEERPGDGFGPADPAEWTELEAAERAIAPGLDEDSYGRWPDFPSWDELWPRHRQVQPEAQGPASAWSPVPGSLSAEEHDAWAKGDCLHERRREHWLLRHGGGWQGCEVCNDCGEVVRDLGVKSEPPFRVEEWP